MNYYKQFAEMLGLELEQEFRLVKPDGTKVDNDLYKITEDGLFSIANDLSGKVTLMLDLLLNRPLCISHSLFSEFHSARFLIRKLKKGLEV